MRFVRIGAPPCSLRCQRLRGVYRRRAPRRQIARKRGDADEADRNGRVRQRIDGLDVVEQRRHQARDGGCCNEADDDADSGKHDALAHDASLHIAGFRAEREANRDLAAAR